MGKLKFHDWDLTEVSDDEVEISFKIKNLIGVPQIVQAFQAGKEMVEGKFADGLVGIISLFSTVYSWIKAGKKK